MSWAASASIGTARFHVHICLVPAICFVFARFRTIAYIAIRHSVLRRLRCLRGLHVNILIPNIVGFWVTEVPVAGYQVSCDYPKRNPA